jgi:aconitate decarboxylase
MLNRETVLDESEFAVGLRYEDLPANVVAYAKQCILDSLGCGIFGAPTSWTKSVARVVAKLGQKQGASARGAR